VRGYLVRIKGFANQIETQPQIHRAKALDWIGRVKETDFIINRHKSIQINTAVAILMHKLKYSLARI